MISDKDEKTVRELLDMGRQRLRLARIETSGLDAALLLMKVTGLLKPELVTKDDSVPSHESAEQYDCLLEERERHRPMAYILGKCEFMGLEFAVDERVLIPRPDSEILVETVLGFLRAAEHSRGVRLLDLGTGSGALAVSIAKHAGNVDVTAVDICRDALAVAAKNAESLGVAARIAFIYGDLFESVDIMQKFDVIISNPPYIREHEELPLSVKAYEPTLALFGGKDGLCFYRRIAEGAGRYLADEGRVFVETGHDQGQSVVEIFANAGYNEIEIIKDLAGRDRVVSAVLSQRG